MRASHLTAAAALTALGIFAPTTAQAVWVSPPTPVTFSGTVDGSGTATASFLKANAANGLFNPAFPTLSAVTINLPGIFSNKPANSVASSFGGVVANTPGNAGIIINDQTNSLTHNFTPSPLTIPSFPGTIAFKVGSSPIVFGYDIWNQAVATPVPCDDVCFKAGGLGATAVLNASTFYAFAQPGAGVLTNNTQFVAGAIPSLPQFGSPSVTYTFVPGPLPVLGAGAAFGWSRRLRKRIAQSA